MRLICELQKAELYTIEKQKTIVFKKETEVIDQEEVFRNMYDFCNSFS